MNRSFSGCVSSFFIACYGYVSEGKPFFCLCALNPDSPAASTGSVPVANVRFAPANVQPSCWPPEVVSNETSQQK